MDFTVLLSSLNSQDASVRVPAENTLQGFRQNNLAVLLSGLCNELANPAKPLPIRQQAGLQLKNTIVSKNDEVQKELAERWANQVGEPVRVGIRQALVRTLGDASKDVRSTAALAIGKIAGIEIPRSLWPNLVEILAQNIGSPASSSDLKQASFEALGYVCEECGPYLQANSDVVLGAIAQGMTKIQPNNEIKLAATTALANSLDFVKAHFAIEKDRHMILAMVFSVCTSEDVRLRVAAFQCLVEIAATYYDYLPEFMRQLFALTGNAIVQEKEEVALQAIEFWTTLADEERARIDEAEEANARKETPPALHNITKLALRDLMPVILKCLTRQNEDVEDDTWNIAMAAATCLGSMSQATGDAILEFACPFIDAHVANPEWRFREAAVLTFGFILDGPSKTALMPLVKKAFPLLLKYMKDPDIHVRDTAAWTIGRICDLLPRGVDDTILPALMTQLHECLTEKPKVAGNVCWAIHNLADAVEVDPSAQTSPLSRYFQTIVVALLQVVQRPDAHEYNLLSSAYETMNVLIATAAQDVFPLIAQLLPTFMKQLQDTFSMPVSDPESRERQAEKQGYLCGALQNIIQKLPEDAIRPAADTLWKLFNAVMDAGQGVGTVNEEALMAVGALAAKLGKNFAPFMPAFMRHLTAALTNWKDYQTCGVAVGVVGDCARALEDLLAPHCDLIMQHLLASLSNPNMERSVKPAMVACLGDIAMALGGSFERYIPYVMMMLAQASAANLDLTNVDNLEYMRSLRENILSTYTSIIQGLNQGNKAALFSQFLGGVTPLLDLIAKDHIADESLVCAAVGLVGDIIQRIGLAARGQIVNDRVQLLIQTASQSEDDERKQTAVWAAQLFSQLMRG